MKQSIVERGSWLMQIIREIVAQVLVWKKKQLQYTNKPYDKLNL